MEKDIKRIVVNQDDFIVARTHLMSTGVFFIAGHSTISVPSSGIKYISERGLRLWPDDNGELVLLTPGEAARYELARCFPDLERVGWAGPAVKLFDKRVPMHYGGPVSSDSMIYIDLKSAYWQIYRLLWLDTSYPRGLYGRYPLFSLALKLANWKAARNAVIGICRSREIVGYRGHVRVKMSTRNKYLSPGLWATVVDILHWIAHQALAFGAVYVNTDGYLFDNLAGADDFMIWMAGQGLLFEVRSRGGGEVRGWNNYKVGNKATKVFTLNLHYYDKEFTNVQKQPEEKWERYWGQLQRIVRSTQGYSGRGDGRKTRYRQVHAGV